MKTFAEANKLLRQFWPDKLSRKVVYTRESMIDLMSYLDNPQDKIKIIHVAGTSGKTSTTYYAAALLRASGKRVGSTVSPHVDEMNERVQIDLVPMPEAAFCRELTEFLKLVKKSGLDVSYFEVLAAFAFWEFARQGVEYAVVEVGLGGLADATNVVNRQDKVCVITDIGLDHMNVLGDTLGEIATQKAGIIQLHNSVFCYRQDQEIMNPIEERVKQKQADLHTLEPGAVSVQTNDLPLFQRRNLGLACAAVKYALERDGQELTAAMIAAATRTYIPARMEYFEHHNRTIIVDGAHNAQKLHALGRSLRQKYAGQPIAAVVGFVGKRGYRLDDATKELAGFLDHVIITSFHGSQDEQHDSEDPKDVARLFERHGAKSVEVIEDSGAALEALTKRPELVLLVAGSFYMLNEIRPLLRGQAA